MDSHDNIWTGDTARGRITEMIPQKNQKLHAAGAGTGARGHT